MKKIIFHVARFLLVAVIGTALFGCGRGEDKFNIAKQCAERNDFEKAVKWYRKAAACGHAEAQKCLGECYEYGRGVEFNDFEAYNWYGRAAEKGNVIAQCKLALFYETGKGRAVDQVKADKWWAKAKSLNKEEAEKFHEAFKARQQALHQLWKKGIFGVHFGDKCHVGNKYENVDLRETNILYTSGDYQSIKVSMTPLSHKIYKIVVSYNIKKDDDDLRKAKFSKFKHALEKKYIFVMSQYHFPYPHLYFFEEGNFRIDLYGGGDTIDIHYIDNELFHLAVKEEAEFKKKT